MVTFKNADGRPVLLKMISAVQQNKAYLSEVDGLIGDGDHGANMNKGFTLFERTLEGREVSFTEGLDDLGMLLFSEIGGSMGPIYGAIFGDMAEVGEDLDEIDTASLATMMRAGLEGLYDIVDARPGDKTLVDTLAPAVEALEQSAAAGEDLSTALPKMKQAAEAGRDSTKDLIAKHGRSSRLGERSKGVLDAGAVSCSLLLQAMADGMLEQL